MRSVVEFCENIRDSNTTIINKCKILRLEYLKKNMFFYISPICPETPIGWIYNKFGTMGLLADVINCANFFIGRSGGIDSVGRG